MPANSVIQIFVVLFKTFVFVRTSRLIVLKLYPSKQILFLDRTDGSFAVNDIPSGSYVVEVVSPGYRFEPVRVDITSKGKMRYILP